MPRAKVLTPRDPRVSPTTMRALERYDAAVAAFDGVCADRFGLGRIDERYADLARAASALIRALLEDRAARRPRWTSAELDTLLDDYARARRVPGDRPEDDLRASEIALRELRSLGALSDELSSGRRDVS